MDCWAVALSKIRRPCALHVGNVKAEIAEVKSVFHGCHGAICQTPEVVVLLLALDLLGKSRAANHVTHVNIMREYRKDATIATCSGTHATRAKQSSFQSSAD